MADIRINLLPWREVHREEKKQEFLKVLVLMVAVGALLIFAVDRFYNIALDRQVGRNQYIESEIGLLQERIEEIQLLQKKRRELLERRKVIEELQGNRPIIVRLFDELARQMSDDVFFNAVVLKEKVLTINGIAKSNNMIARQLRHFSKSDWFDLPNVTEISAAPEYGDRASDFALTVLQSTPTSDAPVSDSKGETDSAASKLAEGGG